MKHAPALYGLIRLHGELAGKILAAKQQIARLKTDLGHVQAVIRLLEPDFDFRTIAIRKRHIEQNRWFRRGECLQAALDQLRRADKPLTSRQIALQILKERDNPDMSEAHIQKFSRTIHVSLRHRKGRSVTIADASKPIRWSLNRP